MVNREIVLENIHTRRSIRSFEATPLPQRDIHDLLHALQAAPSAGNLQPWRFFCIRNPRLKDELCALSFNQKAVAEAPLLILICACPAESAVKYGELGTTLFCVQDTAAATQNLLLAAHAMGYGSLWVGVVQEAEIRACLGIDADLKPMALVAIGRSAETPTPVERRGIDQVTRYFD